jgi:hypothetical protein
MFNMSPLTILNEYTTIDSCHLYSFSSRASGVVVCRWEMRFGVSWEMHGINGKGSVETVIIVGKASEA